MHPIPLSVCGSSYNYGSVCHVRRHFFFLSALSPIDEAAP